MADKKEQEMLEQIRSYQNKKDYYQLLGLSKSAADSDIKKAYRTLALRFHPDKNPHQGAKEVFKKVSNAYSTLIDAQKRAHYDRFGLEQEQPRPQYRQGNYQQDYQFEDMDEMFRAFFGQMPMQGQGRRGNVHTYTYSFGGNQQQGQQRGGFNLYYIFVIIFILYSIAPLFQSKPSYSATPSQQYRFRVTTSLLNVQYFANQHFFEQAKDYNFKKQAEMTIDRQHLVVLQRKCETVKREKKRLEEFAYRQQPGGRRESYLTQARSVTLEPCHTINDYRTSHEDYIRDLTYMR